MRSILLIGFGTIGRHVARLLAPERSAGTITLTALVADASKHADHLHLGAEVVDLNPRSPGSSASTDAPGPTDSTDTPGPAKDESRAEVGDGDRRSRFLNLLHGTDLAVECASVAAAAELGPTVIAAGRPLVLTSVGALADAGTRPGLVAGPGHLHVTNGAIGGLDVLEAAAQADALDTVEITTSKEASGLIRPWMSTPEAQRLHDLRPADGPLTVFAGNPAEAIDKFPANVNVAVALAWMTRGFSLETSADALMEASLRRVRVSLQAVSGQTESTHRIAASGAAGDFAFTIRSAPSPENPATSGLTALSVARTLRTALCWP